MADRVEEDPAPSFPFSMVEKMMPMYPMIAVIGWMIVGIALIATAFSLSPALETWFDEIKPVREANPDKISTWQDVHMLETWIPNFKFFGLGLGLLAINMALGTIAKRLRTMGKVITGHIEESRRPATPEIPTAVKMFQMSAMMGIMILLLTMILGFIFAFGQVSDYYGSGTQSELNQYGVGGVDSDKLSDFGFVTSLHIWLGPLRMLGMGFLLLGITIALRVIIGTLNTQNDILNDLK